MGQTGNPYGRQISSPYGGGGRAPQPFPSTPFPGLGQMNPMLNNPGGITGWQTQTQPMGAPQGMSSRGDPTAQE